MTTWDLPRAVVVLAGGHPGEGALNVVRGLGRQGVPVTVLTEYAGKHAAASRYCKEVIVFPELMRRPDRTLSFLLDYAERHDSTPVLFPTNDPELKLLSDLSDELSGAYNLIAPNKSHLDGFSDKARFRALAEQYDFPVPRTFQPESEGDLERISREVRYPVVVKPAGVMGWNTETAEGALRYKKALRLDTKEELIELYRRIPEGDRYLLVQEYIHGPDEAHFDIHIYMDKTSQPVAYFTGQKLRIYPAYAGSGCYVNSIIVNPIVGISIKMLQAMGYHGLANINFKRDSETGEYMLMEINPRVSQWNILATECGVNLPYIAYADAVGIDYERPAGQKENIKYLTFKNDLKAFLEYKRNGDWTWWPYLKTLMPAKKVYQYYARDDLSPFVLEVRHSFSSMLRR